MGAMTYSDCVPIKTKILKSGPAYVAWGYDGPPPIPRVYLGVYRDRDSAAAALQQWNQTQPKN